MAITEIQKLQIKSAIKVGVIKELHSTGIITTKQFENLMKLHFKAA